MDVYPTGDVSTFGNEFFNANRTIGTSSILFLCRKYLKYVGRGSQWSKRFF